ncbi:hypothetical protein [Mycolicibacterium sp. P1-5]|uniref:hypothetical protein n=1 Tax=Mycolicibacterium sp. P1-5 TaxID=2024617 RepID=UPI0011ECB73E|nr:hypothetical protein [Mycolicibacterium sp. P1-5]KAA0107584.1 hypothetical protein CIW47_18370 [Mycolicibacterium sp. P1-5]
MSVDGFAKFDGSQQLAAWVDRLDAFVTALGAIDTDDAYSFCEDAWDIWESAAIADPPSATDPAMLLVLGVIEVLAEAMTSAARDHHSTPKGADRLTLSAVHASLIDELDGVRRECERWRHDGLPAPAAVKAMSVVAMAGLQVATTFGNQLSA